jgi:hypothetical protein
MYRPAVARTSWPRHCFSMPSSTDKTSFRRTKAYDRAGCLIRHMIKILANSLVPVFAGLLLGCAAGLREVLKAMGFGRAIR